MLQKNLKEQGEGGGWTINFPFTETVILCAQFSVNSIEKPILWEKIPDLSDERIHTPLAEENPAAKDEPEAEKIFCEEFNVKLRKTIDKCWHR